MRAGREEYEHRRSNTSILEAKALYERFSRIRFAKQTDPEIVNRVLATTPTSEADT